MQITETEQLPQQPACWANILERARQLGTALGIFARLDYYADCRRGALLGEITLTPNMGQSPALYAPWVNGIVAACWCGVDGGLRGLHLESSEVEPGAVPQADARAEAVSSRARTTLAGLIEQSAHGLIVPWCRTDILAAVAEFDLRHWGVKRGARVGLLLPHGPRAALYLLAVMNKYVIECDLSNP